MKKIAIALVLAYAGTAWSMTYFLTDQWLQGTERMCKYSNGTVLNVGARVCPMSIEG